MVIACQKVYSAERIWKLEGNVQLNGWEADESGLKKCWKSLRRMAHHIEVGTQENEGRTDFHNLWQTLRWLTKHGSLEALLGEYTSMAISIEHADEQGGMKVRRKGTSLLQKNVTVHEADI